MLPAACAPDAAAALATALTAAASSPLTHWAVMATKAVAYLSLPTPAAAAALNSAITDGALTPSLAAALGGPLRSFSAEFVQARDDDAAAVHAIAPAAEMTVLAVGSTDPAYVTPAAPGVVTTVVIHPMLPRQAHRHALGPAAIPGLLVIHDFVTPAQEADLLGAFDGAPWDTTMSRPVQHYGHAFDYVTRATVATGPRVHALPAPDTPLGRLLADLQSYGFVGDAVGDAAVWDDACLARPLAGRAELDALAAAAGVSPAAAVIDQVTVNAYAAGQGIAGHIDTHESFEEGVVSLSLGGDVVMEFTYAASEPRTDAALSCTNSRMPAAGHPALVHALPPGTASIRRAALLLPARSLLVMRGEARYAWSHAIPARRTDWVDARLTERPARRVSATCRIVRAATPAHPAGDLAACRCVWKSVCKSQSVSHDVMSPHLRAAAAAAAAAASTASMTPAAAAAAAAVTAPTAPPSAPTPPTAPTIPDTTGDGLAPPAVETEHVHALYDAIAPHFSATRYAPWPAVETFLRGLPAGALVADVGCGNGKYMGVVPGLHVIGCDTSVGLLDIAAGRGYEVAAADGVALPFRSHAADAALCIAVLHHLATPARRRATVAELFRILRPGGVVFIQAWAREQGADSRRAFAAPDVFVPWSLQPRYVDVGAAGSGGGVSGGGGAVRPAGGGGPPPVPLATLVAAGGTLDAATGAVVFQRYCHVFAAGELEELVASAVGVAAIPTSVAAGDALPTCALTPSGGAAITRLWWERDNWCLIATKVGGSDTGGGCGGGGGSDCGGGGGGEGGGSGCGGGGR